MAKRTTNDAIKNYERIAGREAAQRVQNYLRAVIQQRLHSDTGHLNDESLIFDTKVKAKMGEYRLLGLNIESPKHAFILHYGFTGVREATTVYYKNLRYKIDKSQRKRHPWKLPAFSIFDDIYEKSGALSLLIEELSRTRTEELQVRLNNTILKFNQGNGKQ